MDREIQSLIEKLYQSGENNVSFHFHPEESKNNAELLKELLRRYEGQKRTIEILMSKKFADTTRKTLVCGAGIA